VYVGKFSFNTTLFLIILVEKYIGMLKRVLIGGLFAILVIIIAAVFLFRKGGSFQEVRIAEAVPSSAIVFIDNIDYPYFAEEFAGESKLWSELITYEPLLTFDSLARRLNDKLPVMPLIREQLEAGAMGISLHLIGKNKILPLVYISLGDQASGQAIDNEIKLAAGKNAIFNVRKYEATYLTDVSFGNSGSFSGISYAIRDGLLILSSSSMLVEDAIRSINSEGGIYYKTGFRTVAGTAGKYVLGNLYLNYTLLDQLFLPAFRNGTGKAPASLASVAQWGEFDIDFRENVLLLNGMTYVNDSLPGWLNVFSGQSPVRIEASSFVPSNAIEFIAAGISDTDRFRADFRKELSVRNELQRFIANDNACKEKLGESIFDKLLELINDEIVWFTLENNKDNPFEQVVMLEVRSQSEAREKLERWISVLAELNGREMGSYTGEYKLDEQVSFTIYSFPELFYEQGIAGKFIRPRFAIYDNYIIFGDTEEAISRTIYQNVLHKTLENEPYYEPISNLVSTRASFTCFTRPWHILSRFRGIMTGEANRLLDSLSIPIQKLPGLVVQFSNEGEVFYSNISLNYTSRVREKAMTVWESLLDSTVYMKPTLVVNHYTSEKEILVQDAKHSVYLVNSTGRILWQVRLDGPILSEIYQVDYYDNGKLQYLFNTETGIHMIDRNGNYVERYPVKLRGHATNGMSLFDYDKRRSYRIFVACNDRKIYVYDLEGNIVSGWSFRRSEGIVTRPIQHFRIADKDYIVFADRIRTYILDRQGHERVKLKEQVVISENNGYYLDMNITGSGPRFVSTDTSGNVFGISVGGEVERILEHDATPGHYFRIKDLDQDGKPECIFADGNELEVVDIKGKRLFSYKIKSDISTQPDIYEFSSSDLKIGLTDREKNQIYLINSDGSLYEGFPLEGDTRFSIGYFAGSDSRFNLIVGSQNGFLYNYSIE